MQPHLIVRALSCSCSVLHAWMAGPHGNSVVVGDKVDCMHCHNMNEHTIESCVQLLSCLCWSTAPQDSIVSSFML